MPSQIDITKPTSGNALTQDVRDNFKFARDEIEVLQQNVGTPGATGASGASGPAGATGPVGATGASGVVGATGASGTGPGGGPPVIMQGAAPTGAQAVDGNLWYNTSEGMLYLHFGGWNPLV